VDPCIPAYKSDKPGIAPTAEWLWSRVYEGEDPRAKVRLSTGCRFHYTRETAASLVYKWKRSRKIPARASSGRRDALAADDNRVYRLMAGTTAGIISLEDSPAGSVVKKNHSWPSSTAANFGMRGQAYLGSLASIERVKNAARDPTTRTGSATRAFDQ